MSNLIEVELVALKQVGDVFVACKPGTNYEKTKKVDLNDYKKASNIQASLADADDSPCSPLSNVVLHQGTIYEKVR